VGPAEAVNFVLTCVLKVKKLEFLLKTMLGFILVHF